MPGGGSSGKKFADAKYASCVPATADSKRTEMKARGKSGFFSTGNPCLITGCFCGKRVFVKVSWQSLPAVHSAVQPLYKGV